MSPQEVKQLTLEQLDDLFRLDIIEADTLIWQPGMSEWLPLSVVAGLGDEDPEPVNIAVSQPPVPNRMAQTQTAWPPVARSAPPSTAPAPPSVRSAPPPLSQRPAPPALSQRPAPGQLSSRPAPPPLSQRPAPPPLSQRPAPPPLSQRPAPPSHAPQASSATSWPPASAWSNPPPRAGAVSPFGSTVPEQPRFAPSSQAPDPFAHTASAAFTTAPVIRAPGSRSGGGSWVILLSLAAGAAVTLYRNDIVHAAMHSIGQEGTFVKLESALGGPSFGTPRAVQQMAAAAAAVTASVPVSETSTTQGSPSTTSTSTGATSPASTGESPKPAETAAPPAPKAAETSAPEPAKPAETPKPEAAKAASAPKTAAAAPRPTPHATSAPEKVDPVFKTPKKGKKGKGSEYDPLNPSL